MIFLLNFQSSFKIQNKELLENYLLVGHAISTDIGVPAKKVRGGGAMNPNFVIFVQIMNF